MARVKIEVPRAQVEAILEFGRVRERFARSQATRPSDGVPTFSAAELAIEAVPTNAKGDDVPVLDLASLEILPADEK
ncbi:MAG: hypothetical protein IPK07_16925 [Deltaproteobacteria bacterium]|nr:hypothetical protein [Deltaproteobacteria bacterium]